MAKAKPIAEGEPFRNSGFVILSTFVICHSSFAVHRPSPIAHRLYERSSLRLPPTAEESRLHRRGRAHARAGHRGEHGDVQCAQCAVASRSPLSEFGATRARLPHVTIITKLPPLRRQLL